MDSDINKSDVQITQLCPCLKVLSIVIFLSSLPLVSCEECEFCRDEIAVLKLF